MSNYSLSTYRAKKLHEKIGAWYQENGRALPWRATDNPYFIWLSEIMLQQTRVAQGLPYWERFIATFPTVQHLAAAPLDDVIKLWEGLGYYSRARNLHKAAQMVCDDFKGRFPDNYQDLITLPGIGPYTAAAISSICFNENRAVVDGNVVRVLSRLLEIPHQYDTAANKRLYDNAALQLISQSDHKGNHNQAMMELGATICTPKQFDCSACPWQSRCAAHKHGTQELFPPPKKRAKLKVRHFHYVLLRVDNKLAIRQRTGKDVWQGLYELPFIESEESPDQETWQQAIRSWLGEIDDIVVRPILYTNDQTLSHQKILGSYYECTVALADGQKKSSNDVLLIAQRHLHKYAWPRLLAQFFKERTSLT